MDSKHFKQSCIAALGVLVCAAGTTHAQSGEQARIAFADTGGVRNWRAEDRDTLYVEDRRGQWYRAELLGPCSGLQFANAIGFVFEPDGSLDRFSSVVVDGRECQFKSLVKTAPPERGRSGASVANQPANADAKSRSDKEEGGRDHREQQSDASVNEEQARIPFAHLRGIESWRAVDDDTLLIEGRNDRWYRAELFAACPGLRHEIAIGFVTQPVGGFDRFSSIVVDGRECRLRSLTETDSPEPRRRTAGEPAKDEA